MLSRLIILAIVALSLSTAPRAAAEDCAGAGSTVALNACLERVFEAEDAELNRVWRRVLGAIDRADYMAPADRAAWTQSLRAAQRAWVTFKEADCKDAVGYEWFGGTGATAAVLSCLIDKTRLRTAELKARYAVE